MFKSIKRGMEILEPYLGDFDVDPVPDSYGNGEAKSSHLVTISVTVGEKEPTDDEIIELRTLGWIFDYPYITLYCPNIYVVPTTEELKAELATNGKLW